jgi:ligand-binding sensor domain-containing protein/DNA-binding CsgD family transcriptional regulator
MASISAAKTPIGLLIIFSFLHLAAAAPKLDMRFQHFGTDEGLSETRVENIFQDRQGFLWIATHNGLDRYDGCSFTHYRQIPGEPNSLSDNYVCAMHDDRFSRLWIGTRTGVDCLDPVSARIAHPNLGLPPSAYIVTLEETRKGEMWIGTAIGRVFRMEIASMRLLPLASSLADRMASLTGSNRTIWRIWEDITGAIWLATKGGLLRYAPATETITQFSTTEDILWPDKSGSFWIIDSKSTKLDRFDPRTGTLMHFPPPKGKAGFYVNTLLADRRQRVWIATFSGIRLFDAKRGQYLELKSFPDAGGEPLRGIINSPFCEDTAGNIWIGVFGSGLYKYSPQSNYFSHIGAHADPRLGLNDPWVCAIRQDRKGMVWIGTWNGGLSCYDPGSGAITHYGGTTDFTTIDSPSRIEALYEDSSGNLWAGAEGNLYLLDRQRNRLQRYPLIPARSTAKSQVPRRIYSIVEESPGRLWIGAIGGGLFLVDTKHHTFDSHPFYEPDPDNPQPIICLLRDHAGILWITTFNGLHCLTPQDGRSVHFYVDPQKAGSISSNHLTGLLEDRNGNLWIGSDQGLNLMDRRHGTFRVFNEKQGLNGNLIYEVTEDEEGMIWAGTNSGLSRFDPLSETFRNFGASDGMAVGGVFTIRRGHGDNVICGGYKGVTIFDPEQVAEVNTHVPPMVVTALSVGNRTVPLNAAFSSCRQAEKPGRVVLGPTNRVLSVEFAALDFTAPEKNRYAFRMEGETRDWNDLGTQHQVTFSGLGAGEHLMHIKGSNNDGVWNEAGVMLQIVVLPYFWQTWWFKLLALLGLSLLAMGLVHLRRRFVALRRLAEPTNLDEICGKHDISKREQEVLRLVIQGKSNRDIENALFISIPTVKRHLANIFEKFGVHSRLQMINYLRVKNAAPDTTKPPRPV